MKIFLYCLYAVFLFAMGTGFYAAFSSYDGLVDSNYYEKSSGYFATKALEDSLGLKIVLPESLGKGLNTVDVAVFVNGKPLEQANVTLFAGLVSSEKYDGIHKMVEHLPGFYRAEVPIPFSGTWLINVDVATETIKTNRKWFTEID
ncbi:MAG: hypothetical protein C1941_04710 [Prosthecochloris sp.]|nr:hypothetical protein [Prosthecochloris sp.]